MKKVLLWILGSIVGIVILAFVALLLFFPKEKIRTLAMEEGSAALGRPVGIGEIDFSFFTGLGVVLNDITIGNPNGWEKGEMASIDKIEVKLQFWPLLSGEYKLDRLIVSSPHIYLRKTRAGVANYVFSVLDSVSAQTPAEAIPSEAKGAAAAVSFDQLELVDGKIEYIDEGSGVSTKVVGLALETSLRINESGGYESKGRLVIDTAQITTDSPFPPVEIGLNYQAQYDIATGQLTLRDTKLSVNGVAVNVIADLRIDSLGTDGTATLNTQDISVSQLVNLLSPKQRELLADYTINGNFSLDAHLRFVAGDTNSPYYEGSAQLNGMKLASKQISGQLLVQKASVDFSTDTVRLTIAEGSFDGNPLLGHAIMENFADPKVRGELGGSVDLAYVQPFLPTAEKHEMSGKSRFNIAFAGAVKQFEQADFSGRVEVENGTYNSPLVPEPLSEIMLDIRFDRNVSTISAFKAKSKSATLSFTGRIEGLLAYLLADSARAGDVQTLLDGRLQVATDLAIANSYLPAKGSPKLTGQADLDLGVTGKINDLTSMRPRGNIKITKASYTDSLLPEPIRQLDASIDLSPDTIRVQKLDLQFVSSDVSLSGKLSRPFPYLLPVKTLDRSKLDKPLFDFALQSHRFDTDKLFPEAVPGAQDSTVTVAVSPDSVSMILLPDFDGRGTINFDTVIYTKVEFTSITGNIKIHDRKIDVENIKGKVYTGNIAGQTTVDLNDFNAPKYSGEFKATQVEADDFISRFTPFSGFLYGKLDLNGAYNATGWEPDAFLNSLTIDGQGAVQSGKLVTSGFAAKAISEVSSKLGEKIEPEQTVKGFLTKIAVENGKVKIDNLKTALGNLGDLEMGGAYGFDGSLGYEGTLIMSKEMSAKVLGSNQLVGSIAGSLVDENTQRLPLPLSIGGTVTNPTLKLDFESMAKQASSSLLKKSGENLLKKAGDLFKKK